MNRIAMVLLVIICLASGAGAQADESGVLVEVTAGEAAVTDWVVEQMLDLATAAQLLGYQGAVQPADVRVVEVDGQGNGLGVVASQVDPAEREGEFVVTWVMPGQTQPGATRYFSVRLQDKGEVPVPQTSIRVSTGEDTITVRNGPIALEHQRGIGGMIREVTVGGTTGAFTWNDKAYDGAVYYLANHRANEMKVVADGPLRAVVETQGEYLDDSNPAASHPQAKYRFTTYAGQPVTHVEAAVTQDFAKQWGSLHFIEIQIGEAPVDSCVTDSGSAVLQQAGRSYDGDQWAAVYGDNLLIGVANGSGPGVWDGGGQHYGAYLRAGTAPWNTSYCPWQATLFWGAGQQDIQRLKSWSAIMASPPTATVHLPPLDNRLAQANSLLTAKERQLATLEGEQWAAAHVAVLLARAHLAAATTKAAAGSFGPAQEALDRAEAALSAQMGESDLEVTDGVMAGLVAGHPYLGNRKVAFVWSRPEDGAGLLSVYDRRARHEFLKVNPTAASLWQIAVKKGEGGESYSNVGVPCIVTREGHRLDFVWGGGMEVRVRATLNRSETVARLRLEAAPQEVGEGLLSVTFPAVKGILPLTQNAKGDAILDTRQLGWERPSPLHSGNVVDTRYPYGMQFSAIVADGRGLYFAEEDPEANRKNLTWSGQQQTG
ncbi:MAG TPA: hypothetical protein ENH48_10270, partial [Halieaceae bacterium]|nr:hypothetical protein [Halieaceae bacterium]